MKKENLCDLPACVLTLAFVTVINYPHHITEMNYYYYWKRNQLSKHTITTNKQKTKLTGDEKLLRANCLNEKKKLQEKRLLSGRKFEL